MAGPRAPDGAPGDAEWAAQRAARWIAEAVETGNPLAPLPEEVAPRDVAGGEEAAAAVLDALGIAACGVRVLFRDAAPAVAGPMIEARLLPNGAAVATAALRHPRVTAAVVGVLAEALEPEGDAPPVFARLHPALDVSATRFTEADEDAVLLTADLARLGYVVAGRGKAAVPGEARVSLGEKGARGRGVAVDLAAAFAEAAAAARRFGGLPAGAVLVVAGLTAAGSAEGVLRAGASGLGAAEARFSAR